MIEKNKVYLTRNGITQDMVVLYKTIIEQHVDKLKQISNDTIFGCDDEIERASMCFYNVFVKKINGMMKYYDYNTVTYLQEAFDSIVSKRNRGIRLHSMYAPFNIVCHDWATNQHNRVIYAIEPLDMILMMILNKVGDYDSNLIDCDSYDDYMYNEQLDIFFGVQSIIYYFAPELNISPNTDSNKAVHGLEDDLMMESYNMNRT